MKMIDECIKVTLTLGQLRRIIKEASESDQEPEDPTSELIRKIKLALRKLDRRYEFSDYRVDGTGVYVEHELEEGEDPDLTHEMIAEQITIIPEVGEIRKLIDGYKIRVYVY